jgi:hypothetical protein
MGKIYVGQTADLEGHTNIDLTNAATLTIKYTDPDGFSGEWTGSVTATPTDGIITYQAQGMSPTGFHLPGDWTLWGHAVMSDGSIYPGEPYRLTIYTEGT